MNPGHEGALHCGTPARFFFWPRVARSDKSPSEQSVTMPNSFRQATDRRPRWSSKTVEELGMVVVAGILCCKPERLRGPASPHRARKGCKTGGECGSQRFCWN